MGKVALNLLDYQFASQDLMAFTGAFTGLICDLAYVANRHVHKKVYTPVGTELANS